MRRFEDALAMFQQAGRFDTPQVSRWISQLALQAFVTPAIAFGLLTLP
jgi:hypothetical protein